MAKMILTFPALGNESSWKLGTLDYNSGKQTCWGVVKDAAGLEYSIPLQEGKAHWTSPVGTEIECEIAVPAADGKRGRVKMVRERPQGGGGFQRREPMSPEKQAEEAKRLAALAVSIYRNIDGLFHGISEQLHTLPTSEDIRSMVNTIIIQIND